MHKSGIASCASFSLGSFWKVHQNSLGFLYNANFIMTSLLSNANFIMMSFFFFKYYILWNVIIFIHQLRPFNFIDISLSVSLGVFIWFDVMIEYINLLKSCLWEILRLGDFGASRQQI